MPIDFSQIDTSIINRMALFLGVLAAGCLFLPVLIGGVLKIMRMPSFIIRTGVMVTGLGWLYYWATQILSEF